MTQAQFERILKVIVDGCMSLERHAAFFQELAARMRRDYPYTDEHIARAVARKRKDKRIEHMN